jgi:hypothetical protein
MMNRHRTLINFCNGALRVMKYIIGISLWKFYDHFDAVILKYYDLLTDS